jgi:hypothetical protein
VPHPGSDPIEEYTLPRAALKLGLSKERIEVYEVGGPRLRNITEDYARYASTALAQEKAPRRVDAGIAVEDDFFGPEWYPREGGSRWMPKRATVTLAGPDAAGRRLYVRGSCAPEQLKNGPFHLSVWAGDAALGTSEVRDCAQPVEFDYALPQELVGKDAMRVTLEVDRPLMPGADPRPLGMVFGVFEVK